MLIALSIVAYLLCCYGSYRIIWDDWTTDFNVVTRADRRFMIFWSSLGPVSLFTALLIFFSRRNWGGDEVIWRAEGKHV